MATNSWDTFDGTDDVLRIYSFFSVSQSQELVSEHKVSGKVSFFKLAKWVILKRYVSVALHERETNEKREGDNEKKQNKA